MANSANLASLEQDEQAIRNLIATWHTATASGDLPILSREHPNGVCSDVVFL
jgi:hypothetical protein